jgi:hypothetical protein
VAVVAIYGGIMQATHVQVRQWKTNTKSSFSKGFSYFQVKILSFLVTEDM